MWTPKRILLLALSMLLCVGSYMAYARQLGKVDGLPPLPEPYRKSQKEGEEPPPPPEKRPNSLTAKRLEMAFGRECPELKRAIKIEVPSRGLVLASKEFNIEDDGRVRLVPLSVAMFGKSKGDDGTPEINTIRGDEAYLTFEHPIKSVSDMGKHRIMSGQIAGNIKIVNNRRSLARDDDLSIDISKGPLYYDQNLQRIWTEDFVHLEDAQSKPRPTEISGQAMTVELLTEMPNAKPGPRAKPRQFDSITGVKRINLKSAVDMHLFVDARSSFLNSGEANASKPKPAEAPKSGNNKAHLIIKTQGPFSYDVEKDFARFDVPATDPVRLKRLPEHVVVTRVHDDLGKLDQLVCEHLELQFQKKGSAANATTPPKPKPTTPPTQSVNLEIETAHATGREVILVSDAETLEAHGNDLFYHAPARTTTLKGDPMWALKEGNEIQAKQLQIKDTPTGQNALAKGPGRLSLFDKNTGKRPMHARWSDTLESRKDGEQEFLHLTGKAAFVDDENGSDLLADDIRVWLMPKDKKPTTPTPAPNPSAEAKSPQKSFRPHHVIASGHVKTKSKEFTCHDVERFVVWFNDAPLPKTPLAPAPAVPGAPAKGGTATAPAPAQLGKPAPEENKKPIDLKARSVEAHVLRIGEKSQLQKMHSEGSVHVVQAPAKPTEKGVDIRGDKLDLTWNPEGNYLVVVGDLARLEMDKMLILGPEVYIDQVANKAWVNGIGAMTMDSDTDFEGKKLKKPTPLTIHWNRAMVFSGPQAVFYGGIQADQENARLTCQEMQVFFDKPISLKQGQKDKEAARVRNLVCDKMARVEDVVLEKGLLLKLNQLSGSALAFDNEEGTVQASGPGDVRIVQRGDGNGNGIGAPAATGPKKNVPDEMKLTFVSYYARMNGYRKKNMAVFYTNVRALHVPLASLKKKPTDREDPRVEIDMDDILKELPEGAMYLRCDRLQVLSRPREGGKASQEMLATGRVVVTSAEFHGQAERVIFDEEKDQVIFDGGEGGIATLTKTPKGAEPQSIEGRKIIYSRKSGKHTGEDIRNIKGG